MIDRYNLFLFIFISILLFFLFTKISRIINLMDFPNQRKKHSTPTPLVGGLVIYSLLLFFYYENFDKTLGLILLSSFVVVSLGVIDDKFDINYKLRLIFQIIATTPIIWSGLYITSFGSYLNFELTIIGFVGIIITYFSVLILINAINFIDGLDGLAASQILISIFSLILFSYFLGNFYFDKLILYLILSLIVFLIFNLGIIPNLKIFLGDSGSNFLGFFLAWLIIFYSNPSNNFIHPVLAIWTITYPLFDFLFVIIFRLLDKKSPFTADLTHLHYKLLSKTNSKIKTLIILILISSSLNTIGALIFFQFNSFLALVFFFLLFLIYLFYNYFFIKKW